MVPALPPPPEIEVVGQAPADPPAPEHDPAARAGRLRWAGALLGAAVLASAIFALVGDREPAPAPPPPSPGIFDRGRIDLADQPVAAETAYPVFGREWNASLLFRQRGGITAVDLDTGVSRIWLPRDEEVAPGGWLDVSVVDGEAYVSFGTTGVARVGPTGVEVVRPGGSPGSSELRGHYQVTSTNQGGILHTSVTHLISGDDYDVENGFAGVMGPDLLIERGGTILRHPGGDPAQAWADGELIATGRDAAVWRRCDAGDCEAWAGTREDPTSLLLDAEVVAEGLRSPHIWDTGFPRVALETISPDGRFSLRWRQLDDAGSLLLLVVDLANGREVAFPRTQVQWLDATTLASALGAAVSLIDVTSGEVARVGLVDGEGALGAGFLALVPHDELPVIE